MMTLVTLVALATLATLLAFPEHDTGMGRRNRIRKHRAHNSTEEYHLPSSETPLLLTDIYDFVTIAVEDTAIDDDEDNAEEAMDRSDESGEKKKRKKKKRRNNSSSSESDEEV